MASSAVGPVGRSSSQKWRQMSLSPYRGWRPVSSMTTWMRAWAVSSRANSARFGTL